MHKDTMFMKYLNYGLACEMPRNSGCRPPPHGAINMTQNSNILDTESRSLGYLDI